MSRWVAWLIAALLLGSFMGWQLVRSVDAAVPLPVLHTLGGDFELESTSGSRLALSEFRGSLVLLNFGYTGCPDVCPTALARMRDALDLAGDGDRPVVPLFVTLDPANDTVERLVPYVRYFHPDLIGLTGSIEEIEAATAPFKVHYERQPAGAAGVHQISHSSHLYLLDHLGRVRGTFGAGVPVGAVADAIRRLQQEAASGVDVAA